MILTLLTRERKIPVVPAGTMGSSRQLHLLLGTRDPDGKPRDPLRLDAFDATLPDP